MEVVFVCVEEFVVIEVEKFIFVMEGNNVEKVFVLVEEEVK